MTGLPSVSSYHETTTILGLIIREHRSITIFCLLWLIARNFTLKRDQLRLFKKEEKSGPGISGLDILF